MNFQVGETIALILCVIILLFLAVSIIMSNYTMYSKKYKELEISKKVSKITKNKKTIVILDTIVVGFPYFLLLEIMGVVFFLICIKVFTDIGEFNWNREPILWINGIAFAIWMCSILISSIYYIIAYAKEMKATKVNEC